MPQTAPAALAALPHLSIKATPVHDQGPRRLRCSDALGVGRRPLARGALKLDAPRGGCGRDLVHLPRHGPVRPAGGLALLHDRRHEARRVQRGGVAGLGSAGLGELLGLRGCGARGGRCET